MAILFILFKFNRYLAYLSKKTDIF